MKKFFVLVAAALSMSLVSCQKSVADQLAAAYNAAAESIANATTTEEVVAVETELSNKIQEIDYDSENVKFTSAEQDKVEAAYAKFDKLYREKISQFGPAANAVDVETFDAETVTTDSATNTGAQLDAAVANSL